MLNYFFHRKKIEVTFKIFYLLAYFKLLKLIVTRQQARLKIARMFSDIKVNTVALVDNSAKIPSIA